MTVLTTATTAMAAAAKQGPQVPLAMHANETQSPVLHHILKSQGRFPGCNKKNQYIEQTGQGYNYNIDVPQTEPPAT